MIPSHSPKVVRTPKELGQALLARRKAAGLGLRAAAPAAGVGVRFLREVEAGKERAEIGKILDALHGLGLDLAIVPRAPDAPPAAGYSQAVGVEFPYDWSNSAMSAELFMRKVLRAGRFMDVLRTVGYFGQERVSREAEALGDSPEAARAAGILARIYQGQLLAQHHHAPAP